MFEFFKFISFLGDVNVMALFLSVLILMFIFYKNYRFSLEIFLSATLATFISIFLKNLFKISRPENMLVLQDGYRFPSGHATAAAVIFTLSIYFIHKYLNNLFLRYIIYFLATIWLTLVCYSRLYLGVHLPIDIFAGIFIGVTITTLTVWIINRKIISLDLE